MQGLVALPLVLILASAPPAEPPPESYLKPWTGAPLSESVNRVRLLRMQPGDSETLRFGLADNIKGPTVGDASWRTSVRLVVLRGGEPLSPDNEEMRPDFLAERIAAIDRREVSGALTIVKPSSEPEPGATEELKGEATISLIEPGEYVAYLFVPPEALGERMSPGARRYGALSDPLPIRVEAHWTPAELAARHYRRAMQQQLAKRDDLALREMDLAIALAPDIGEYHCQRGVILFLLERPGEARESFVRALALYRQGSIAVPYLGWRDKIRWLESAIVATETGQQILPF